MKFGGNVRNGFFPTDGLKLSQAFGPDPLERVGEALGAVSAFGIPRNLGAQHPLGVQVVGIALYFDGTAIFHGGQQRAGVGAVVRAQTPYDGIFFEHKMGHGFILKGYFWG